MSENEELTSISKASTLEEIAEFWDTRRRITLDPEVYAQVQNVARKRGVLPETLVNIWLVERLQNAV